MPQVLDGRRAQNTLLLVEIETSRTEATQDLVEIAQVLGLGLTRDKDVIQINKNSRQTRKDTVHESLEGLGRVFEPKGHPQELK